MSEAIKICSNCEKEIPESKFMLHEPFCLRNVKKCGECGEIINIEEEDEHKNEFHVDVLCKYCNKHIPKTKITLHEDYCDEKPVECKYCLLQVSSKEKKDHEYICGSKTEYCINCKKYIPIKDYEMHNEVGCYPDDIYLSNNIAIENISEGAKKKNSKVGKIANVTKMGLMNNNNKKDDVYNELSKKIENMLGKKETNNNNVNHKQPIHQIKKEESVNINNHNNVLKDKNDTHKVEPKSHLSTYKEMLKDVQKGSHHNQPINSNNNNNNKPITSHGHIDKPNNTNTTATNNITNTNNTTTQPSSIIDHTSNNQIKITTNSTNKPLSKRYNKNHLYGNIVKSGNVKVEINNHLNRPKNVNEPLNFKKENSKPFENNNNNPTVKKLPYTKHTLSTNPIYSNKTTESHININTDKFNLKKGLVDLDKFELNESKKKEPANSHKIVNILDKNKENFQFKNRYNKVKGKNDSEVKQEPSAEKKDKITKKEK